MDGIKKPPHTNMKTSCDKSEVRGGSIMILECCCLWAWKARHHAAGQWPKTSKKDFRQRKSTFLKQLSQSPDINPAEMLWTDLLRAAHTSDVRMCLSWSSCVGTIWSAATESLIDAKGVRPVIKSQGSLSFSSSTVNVWLVCSVQWRHERLYLFVRCQLEDRVFVCDWWFWRRSDQIPNN